MLILDFYELGILSNEVYQAQFTIRKGKSYRLVHSDAMPNAKRFTHVFLTLPDSD
ncbi:MAG: hypothetical protein BroJett018_01090 [Chloroflexota bacterium]|nr:hypothetical protein [Chloroflexota bacterium]GIK62315.1 MAG: hypothetical protein BroJett018_01090 [Chloroflexota bacterium]